MFADVIEPPIEVNGVSHGSGHDGDQAAQEEVPVGPVGSERMSMPAEQRVPAGAGSRVPAGAGQLGAGPLGHSIGTGQVVGQIGARHIAPGQIGQGQKLTVPGRIPIGTNLAVGEPAFDQVTRTVREITNMVPV